MAMIECVWYVSCSQDFEYQREQLMEAIRDEERSRRLYETICKSIIPDNQLQKVWAACWPHGLFSPFHRSWMAVISMKSLRNGSFLSIYWEHLALLVQHKLNQPIRAQPQLSQASSFLIIHLESHQALNRDNQMSHPLSTFSLHCLPLAPLLLHEWTLHLYHHHCLHCQEFPKVAMHLQRLVQVLTILEWRWRMKANWPFQA